MSKKKIPTSPHNQRNFNTAVFNELTTIQQKLRFLSITTFLYAGLIVAIMYILIAGEHL